MLTCDAALPLRTVLSKSGDAGNFLLRVIQEWTNTPIKPIVLAAMDKDCDIHRAIDQALTSQTNIGWVHFFRGFVSLDWVLIQYPRTEIHRLTSNDRRSQPNKTVTTVISAVHDYTVAIWKSRNEVLYESGSDSLTSVHAALNYSIPQLYSLQTTFSPILQSYFTMPLEERLRRSPRQRQHWL